MPVFARCRPGWTAARPRSESGVSIKDNDQVTVRLKPGMAPIPVSGWFAAKYPATWSVRV